MRISEVSLFSLIKKKSFPINGGIDCHTHNFSYCVTCLKCYKQGIGETDNFPVRARQYLSQISRGGPAPPACCNIVRHFLEEADHSVDDLMFHLIDRVPPDACIPSCVKAVRLRLESDWTEALRADLNIRRQIRHSFPGATR